MAHWAGPFARQAAACAHPWWQWVAHHSIQLIINDHPCRLEVHRTPERQGSQLWPGAMLQPPRKQRVMICKQRGCTMLPSIKGTGCPTLVEALPCSGVPVPRPTGAAASLRQTQSAAGTGCGTRGVQQAQTQGTTHRHIEARHPVHRDMATLTAWQAEGQRILYMRHKEAWLFLTADWQGQAANAHVSSWHCACPQASAACSHSQGVVHAIPLLAQGVALLGAVPYVHRMG